MKSRLFILVICLTTFADPETGSAQNENTMNGPVALKGGMVSRAGNYYIELLFKPNDTTLVYLFDENSKSLSNIAVIGKIVFQHYDSTITAVDLKPFNNSSFTVITAFSTYKRCDVYLEVNGSGILARFQKEERLAKK